MPVSSALFDEREMPYLARLPASAFMGASTSSCSIRPGTNGFSPRTLRMCRRMKWPGEPKSSAAGPDLFLWRQRRGRFSFLICLELSGSFKRIEAGTAAEGLVKRGAEMAEAVVTDFERGFRHVAP